MNNHNLFLIFFSFPTRLFNPCSALLLSFDRHLLRFQSFQELFLFSAILVFMYNCFVFLISLVRLFFTRLKKFQLLSAWFFWLSWEACHEPLSLSGFWHWTILVGLYASLSFASKGDAHQWYHWKFYTRCQLHHLDPQIQRRSPRGLHAGMKQAALY